MARATSVATRGRILTVAVFLIAALAAGARASYAQYCPGAAPWPLAPNDNNNSLLGEYEAWKATYVVAAPTGKRVIRTENANDTVSEGVAYGMILAAYLNDKSTLDALWAYVEERTLAYPTGTDLMHWRFSATGEALHYDGTVLQQADERLGPASDAEEDMALALIVADKKWGGYQSDIVPLLANMMQWEVEPGTFVFKPGKWGGAAVLNPSYLAPGYYKVFKQYLTEAGSPQPDWQHVTNKVYTMIGALNAASAGASTTGLIPDWMKDDGTPAPGMGYNYLYDGIRAPWRLAVDAAWHCSDSASSSAQVAKMNAFFAGVGASQIKDGYTLDGTVVGQYSNAAFVGTAAAASLLSTDAKYRNAVWQETYNAWQDNYYSATLRLLALLLLSGHMPPPGNVPAVGAPVGGTLVTDWEDGTLSSWADLNPGKTTSYVVTAPNAADGSWSMRIDFSLAAGEWGASGRYFGTAQNWSANNGIAFWYYGDATWNRIRLEIEGSGGERFEYTFDDRAHGWRYFRIPWSAWVRRTDWQPPGAPQNSILTALQEVRAINFQPMYVGVGNFRVDSVRVW